MDKINIALTVLLSLLSLVLQGQAEPNIVVDRYKTKNFDCAIFPKEYTINFVEANRFTPSRQEIDKAENALNKDLERLNSTLQNQGGHNPIIHNNLEKYKRQYIGYIDQEGDKILYIICLWAHKDIGNDWLKEIVIILDGGSRYWAIKYNLTKNQLFQLMVNGDA